jgi:hypothetical protein
MGHSARLLCGCAADDDFDFTPFRHPPAAIAHANTVMMNRLSACALGMVLLNLSLVSTEASKDVLGSRSFRGSTEGPLPRASLNTPVDASNPDDWEPSREDVLSVYPSKFIVDWDDLPTTDVAVWMYQNCGIVVTTTCEIREEEIACWCAESVSSFNFWSLQFIGQQDINTPVQASPHLNGVPTIAYVLQIYGISFVVDWTEGHNVTKAGGILFDACDTVPAICMVRLECLCGGFESPVFLGFETLRSILPLPHTSLNMPVNASVPGFPSMEEVLRVYPRNFIVSWDGIPETYTAAIVYESCGAVDRTQCKIRETNVVCWCAAYEISPSLPNFKKIAEQDLNSPVEASGPDPNAVPTMDDVQDVYPYYFLVDWKVGHNGTVAARVLFSACGTVPTTCITEEARLECLCNDSVSPIFLGYEMLRPPSFLSKALAAAVPA